MRIRKLAISGLLTLSALASAGTPAAAQIADTISPRPLFTYRDAVLAGVFVVGTFAVFPFDKHYAQQLQDSSRQDSRFYSDMATVVRTVAEPGSYLIGGGMYIVGRLAKQEKLADLGWHGTEAVIVGSVFGTIVKGAAGRGRPYLKIGPNGEPDPRSFKFGRGFGKDGGYRSFPSGHTLAAFAAASAVSNETSRWWPNTRWIIGPAMYGGATLVGLSRMYNNRHWASDVLMGAAIGTFAGNKVVRYHHSHPKNKLDRWILGASIVPSANGGYGLAFSLTPGSLAPVAGPR